MKQNKFILIDGENLIHVVINVLREEKIIKSRDELSKFELKKFLKACLDDSVNSKVEFFTTKLRYSKITPETEKRSKQILERSRVISSKLWQQGVSVTKSGNLVMYQAEKCPNCGHTYYDFREKGVDVGLATELLKLSFHKSASEIVILSSDSDLIPAVKEAKGNSRIIYLAFSEKVNRSLASCSDELRVFTRVQIIKYFGKQQ